jgi:hypothetical protein
VLRQELPAGRRTHDTELAKDLASLAADGGLLLIGVGGAAACGGSSFVASTRMVAAITGVGAQLSISRR